MANSKYCYIRVIHNGKKYRSYGFDTVREFWKYVDSIKYDTPLDKDIPANELKPHMPVLLELWRSNTNSNNHYLMGIITNEYNLYNNTFFGNVLKIPNRTMRFGNGRDHNITSLLLNISCRNIVIETIKNYTLSHIIKDNYNLIRSMFIYD